VSTTLRRHDQPYADAQRSLRLHQRDPSGAGCDQLHCVGQTRPCTAVLTARSVVSMYDTDEHVPPPTPLPSAPLSTRATARGGG
jgi:hypothetical protein